MTIAENLRARAEYMREFGFSPFFGVPGCAACFMGAHHCALPDDEEISALNGDEFLRDVIFDGDRNWYSTDRLIREGWTTDDAIAALEIAADIAEATGA